MKKHYLPSPLGIGIAVGLTLALGLFLAFNLSALLPGGSAAGATSEQQNTRMLMVHYSLLPRLAVSLLAGAALGLAGAILQRLLRNPLAEPSTLGVSAGAYLALAVATLFAPGLAAAAPELVTFAGALMALGAVLALSWRKSLSPVTVTLAGLIVSLYCAAVSSVLTLFYHDFLAGQIMWGAGFLDQQDWSAVHYLWPRLLVATLTAVLLLRPLSIMSLGDESARGLGLSLATYRLLALAVAAGLAAVATSAVGIIGFIGLAAPTLARAAGVRTGGALLFWSGLMGALLLSAADQLVQSLPVTFRVFPTGAITGLLGTPLLFLLIRRLKMLAPQSGASHQVRRLAHPYRVLAILAGLAAFGAWLALGAGRGNEGWSFTPLPPAELLIWRAPRALAAFSGGAMLALAGAIMQRSTGNPMASPEVLGVSSGAILGVICATLGMAEPTRTAQIAAGGVGAFAVLVLMRLLSRQPGFSGERLLLIGIALGSVSSFITAVLMVSQDPRLNQLLAWLSGSTYAVSGGEALVAAGLLTAGLACVPLLHRWLELLPLGTTQASALGLRLDASRNALFAIASVLTAGATMLVGPLSFAGLMGPHLARLAGFQRAATHLLASALVGGLILLTADWIGRNILFPFQVPAGLLAALVGGPFLLYLIGRRA
ncbi:iron complex transport system permease protein [Rhodoferax sp. OV413]|uniref:Fe(3+)-hydroxamate ABC transporter permease FhuB n=1 Tax=Rhodoferax sp. OV413 TaxID=1855285 RepID=UPI000880F4BA|nr:Fe(3+)-hydroxamate ABC transporter permease FhuB [Rhodoferax sp. OV413]SDP62432.1 iron complex transport system permease protein [Rhodoferax sp. OV413]